MVYLYIDKNTIKLLALKKTLLGQQETTFYQKNYESNLLEKGQPVNTDLLASAIKEVLIAPSLKPVEEDQITLILPQEIFYFMRSEVPTDIAPSALDSFINDKARSLLPIDVENCLNDSFVYEANGEKVVTFYGLSQDFYLELKQVFSLIDLKLNAILPDTLAYFKLFEKTLRQDKKETILYLTLEKEFITGYLFDSFGLLSEKRFDIKLNEGGKIEDILKEKAKEIAVLFKKKLNRIIISGEPSDKIRQDTFTKSVGVWTNPLKRIVPNFYEEYLKMIVVDNKKPFPLLSFDVCFGSFIFSEENKDFSLLKNASSLSKNKKVSFPKISLPKKEVLIFILSFLLSFLLFIFISKFKSNIKLPVTAPSPTPTPAPTVTPTPAFKKEDLKIKVLNGSGTKGKATEVKDLLKNKGYSEIVTDNADNFNYEKTEIQVKKSFSQAVTMIEADLKDYLVSPNQTVLTEKETADLVIIIGKDFK
jgi:hypothetical protein